VPPRQGERGHHRAGEADPGDQQAAGVQAGQERVLGGGQQRRVARAQVDRCGDGVLGLRQLRRPAAPNAPSASRAPYTLENREPTTATPSVAPSSRVASLTAEPTPARAGGSTSMIDSVAGVAIRPMPSPMSTIWGTITLQ
jgi:hypothetical protein